MKHIITLLAFSGLLAACSGPSATQSAEAEKEAIVMDSIANTIDQSADALKKEAKDVEASVDALLEE